MDLKEQDILGDAIGSHWYYVSKGRALRAFLGGFRPGEVLDVGAGSGVFGRQLIDAGLSRRVTCVDPGYEREYVEPYAGGELVFVRSAEPTVQKLVLMMDVLEHVDDDVALLRSYSRALPHDGRILITVPAFQFLWSGHDVFLEHRRRYTRRSLEDVVRAAGLVVERSRYFFGSLFPLVAITRLAQRVWIDFRKLPPRSSLRLYPPAVNAALVAVHELERRILFPVNGLAGLTVFCLARPGTNAPRPQDREGAEVDVHA